MRDISSYRGKIAPRSVDRIIAAGPAPVTCYVNANSHPLLYEVLVRMASQEGFGTGHRTFYLSASWREQVDLAEHALQEGANAAMITHDQRTRYMAFRNLLGAIQHT